MKVALIYDEPLGPESAGKPRPEDMGAEYESKHTIEALLQAIRACGHKAVGISLSEDFPRRIRRLKPDLVFNIAEGVRGPARESIVPAWLDHLGIPYTGSDGLALAVSLDKALTKTLASASGLRTPAFARVRCLEDLDNLELKFPLFVKPNAEGSSMGIRSTSRVETRDQLQGRVAWILESYEQDCLVEEFAPGREFCLGIIGNEKPRLLPVVEIHSQRNFYPYEEKHDHQRELICPAEITENLAGELCRMGLKIFITLACRDLARVDFKLDDDGRPTFLEINPLPGLSPDYGILPYQAAAAGLSHQELIGKIIDSARQRKPNYQDRHPLQMRISEQTV
jgi:D-alanine-D-alanine ligase